MLIEVNAKTYKHYFSVNPHPYVSEPFIELNKGRVDRVVRLIEDRKKVAIGLVAGIKDGVLKSPFSAPFGGFHFRHNKLYVSEIEHFLSLLKSYVVSLGLKKVEITLPPDIYHRSFNTKTIITLLRSDFSMAPLEITNWVNLRRFTGVFSDKNVRTLFNQAVRHELSFHSISEKADKQAAFELVCQNRERAGRPIFMIFTDLMNTSELWPVDYFRVNDKEGNMVAVAIFYRSHASITQAVFWGDNEHGRPLRAMDFLSSGLWNYYKMLGYDFIDLGISTESGTPNEGLLRFKETHDSTSSLRFSFFWSPM